MQKKVKIEEDKGDLTFSPENKENIPDIQEKEKPGFVFKKMSKKSNNEKKINNTIDLGKIVKDIKSQKTVKNRRKSQDFS